MLVLTGGGTAGHVMPNLALAPGLRAAGWTLHYFGSQAGPERGLAEAAGIPFDAIASGKLRRYFSWKNFVDPFRVIRGLAQAHARLGALGANLVFSKGGFVAVPVVYAAFLRRIPVVLHESDLTPGLANRLCLPACRRVCVSFPETLRHLPPAQAMLTGPPLRAELFHGRRDPGLARLGFTDERPVVLAVGGSSGSSALNQAVRAALPRLTERYQVAHICGPGRVDASLGKHAGYRQFEFLRSEWGDVMAAADLVVTRAGANAVFEFLALRKPCLLIPLPATASRGDQILNADSFAARGLVHVLPQEALTAESLAAAVTALERDADRLRRALNAEDLAQGNEKVLAVIETVLRESQGIHA